MSSCLGIYIGEKIIKYAKLVKEDTRSEIKATAYGAKVHLGNKNDVIQSIIAATGSDSVPVCINAYDENVHKTEALKIIGKSDLESLVDLEVVDFLGNEDKNERSSVYKYVLLDSLIAKDNYSVNIIMMDKSAVDKYLADEQSEVTNMYSLPYILDEIVTRSEHNYLIINMNETTDLIFVNDGKLIEVTSMDLGMKKILDTFPEMLGSYQKSYDVCKTINVFSDETNVNNPELENVIEPVLQDVLNRIQLKLKELNLRVDKIYLSGAISLFINSDMLFEQYFEISTEKLKPYFIDSSDENHNMSEVTEAAEAFALAYEGLMVERPDLDFLRQPKKFSLQFPKTIKKNSGAKEVSQKKSKTKKINANENFTIGNISLEKLKPILIFANIIMLVVLIAYVAFSSVFGNQMDNQIKAVSDEKAKIDSAVASVNSDINYIDANAKKYTSYTSYIEETLRKLKQGEIGKYSTYNVALFMMKVSKYIPDGVTLTSIKSDSKKHVTIVATSPLYSELGYFISQLKLEGILNPATVSTTASTHKDIVTVTIGGDLPWNSI